MKKFDEEEELSPPEMPEEDTYYKNTVELSNKGLSQKILTKLIQNEIKIRKIKLKALIKEKKEIKQYLKENLMKKGTKEAK